MRLLARLAPRLSASSLASSSSRRLVHATPSLDPSQHIPEPTLANVAATSQQERIVTAVARQDVELAEAVAAAASSENFVHVKMQYLHPSTKDAVKIPRPADVKVKRVRAEPHYVPLSAHVFGVEPRRDILHSAVVYYLDSLRVGGANTKTRGEVAYSTRKMYQQKGTGRARRGSRGSPLLRKGGVAHGPVPRDFSTKLNRRVRELALRSALSLRWRSGDLVIVKNLHWDAAPGSTSPLAKLLKTKGWDDALFLTAPRNPQAPPRLGLTGKTSAADPVYTPEQVDEHTREFVDFSKAVNNIPRTRLVVLNDLTRQAHESARNKEDLKKPGELHAYEVLQRKKLICDLGAIEWLEVQQGGALFHTAIEYQTLSLHELMAEIDGVGAQGEIELDSVAEVEEVEDASEAEVSEDEAELQAEEDRAIEEETTRVLQGVPDQSGEAPSSKKQQ